MHVILDRDEGIYAESVLVDLFCPFEKRFSPFSPLYSFITFLRILYFDRYLFFSMIVYSISLVNTLLGDRFRVHQS